MARGEETVNGFLSYNGEKNNGWRPLRLTIQGNPPTVRHLISLTSAIFMACEEKCDHGLILEKAKTSCVDCMCE